MLSQHTVLCLLTQHYLVIAWQDQFELMYHLLYGTVCVQINWVLKFFDFRPSYSSVEFLAQLLTTTNYTSNIGLARQIYLIHAKYIPAHQVCSWISKTQYLVTIHVCRSSQFWTNSDWAPHLLRDTQSEGHYKRSANTNFHCHLAYPFTWTS